MAPISAGQAILCPPLEVVPPQIKVGSIAELRRLSTESSRFQERLGMFGVAPATPPVLARECGLDDF